MAKPSNKTARSVAATVLQPAITRPDLRLNLTALLAGQSQGGRAFAPGNSQSFVRFAVRRSRHSQIMRQWAQLRRASIGLSSIGQGVLARYARFNGEFHPLNRVLLMRKRPQISEQLEDSAETAFYDYDPATVPVLPRPFQRATAPGSRVAPSALARALALTSERPEGTISAFSNLVPPVTRTLASFKPAILRSLNEGQPSPVQPQIQEGQTAPVQSQIQTAQVPAHLSHTSAFPRSTDAAFRPKSAQVLPLDGRVVPRSASDLAAQTLPPVVQQASKNADREPFTDIQSDLSQEVQSQSQPQQSQKYPKLALSPLMRAWERVEPDRSGYNLPPLTPTSEQIVSGPTQRIFNYLRPSEVSQTNTFTSNTFEKPGFSQVLHASSLPVPEIARQSRPERTAQPSVLTTPVAPNLPPSEANGDQPEAVAATLAGKVLPGPGHLRPAVAAPALMPLLPARISPTGRVAAANWTSALPALSQNPGLVARVQIVENKPDPDANYWPGERLSFLTYRQGAGLAGSEKALAGSAELHSATFASFVPPSVRGLGSLPAPVLGVVPADDALQPANTRPQTPLPKRPAVLSGVAGPDLAFETGGTWRSQASVAPAMPTVPVSALLRAIERVEAPLIGLNRELQLQPQLQAEENGATSAALNFSPAQRRVTRPDLSSTPLQAPISPRLATSLTGLAADAPASSLQPQQARTTSRSAVRLASALTNLAQANPAQRTINPAQASLGSPPDPVSLLQSLTAAPAPAKEPETGQLRPDNWPHRFPALRYNPGLSVQPDLSPVERESNEVRRTLALSGPGLALSEGQPDRPLSRASFVPPVMRSRAELAARPTSVQAAVPPTSAIPAPILRSDLTYHRPTGAVSASTEILQVPSEPKLPSLVNPLVAQAAQAKQAPASGSGSQSPNPATTALQRVFERLTAPAISSLAPQTSPAHESPVLPTNPTYTVSPTLWRKVGENAPVPGLAQVPSKLNSPTQPQSFAFGQTLERAYEPIPHLAEATTGPTLAQRSRLTAPGASSTAAAPEPGPTSAVTWAENLPALRHNPALVGRPTATRLARPGLPAPDPAANTVTKIQAGPGLPVSRMTHPSESQPTHLDDDGSEGAWAVSDSASARPSQLGQLSQAVQRTKPSTNSSARLQPSRSRPPTPTPGPARTGLHLSTLDTVLKTSVGQPLDTTLQRQMSDLFGRTFEGIRVHTDDAAARYTRQAGAEAFTAGSHIFFGPGRYQPHNPTGQALIGHELTHIVQQASLPSLGGGRLPETGTVGQTLEREALQTEQMLLRHLSSSAAEKSQANQASPAHPSSGAAQSGLTRSIQRTPSTQANPVQPIASRHLQAPPTDQASSGVQRALPGDFSEPGLNLKNSADETRPSEAGVGLDLDVVAAKVYSMLRQKLLVERERNGILGNRLF